MHFAKIYKSVYNIANPQNGAKRNMCKYAAGQQKGSAVKKPESRVLLRHAGRVLLRATMGVSLDGPYWRPAWTDPAPSSWGNKFGDTKRSNKKCSPRVSRYISVLDRNASFLGLHSVSTAAFRLQCACST